MDKNLLNGLDEVSRRNFLATSAKSLLGMSAMPLFARLASGQTTPGAGLMPATARNVIYLYMSGGMSQLDTFDPKPGEENQGPVKAIPTNVPGVQVSEHFPNMARHMDKVAVLNSMRTTQGAHAQGKYFMHTSYEMRATIRHPSLGAWLNRIDGPSNPTLPGHVAIGNELYGASSGFLESNFSPLPIGDPEAGLQNSTLVKGLTEERFHDRLSRIQKLNAAFVKKYDQKNVRAYSDIYDQAVSLMKSVDLKAFDLKPESEALREAYGKDRFGQGCLLARRLIEHGVRYVEVVSDGWDTHNQNFDELAQKGPALDQTLATLLADLSSRGLLEETLVVVATEFGRTPRITQDRVGRDHFPQAFSCLLAGGGIQGGVKYGRTSNTGEEITKSPVSVPDFNATIAYALGLPLDHILMSPSGRPFTVAHKGRPVKALFS